MGKSSRQGWLTSLSVLALCLPCILGPLAALGAGAVLAGLGGVVIGTVLLAAGAALMLLLVAALVVRRRRRTAASCASAAPAVEPRAVGPLEVR
jgi:tetrahydromethanopterin S-methyltransferase subunit D